MMDQNQVERYEDGGLKAHGQKLYGIMVGYWEWFRRDGTKMRSGYYDAGKPVGEWISYDLQGKPYKVTDLDKKTRP